MFVLRIIIFVHKIEIRDAGEPSPIVISLLFEETELSFIFFDAFLITGAELGITDLGLITMLPLPIDCLDVLDNFSLRGEDSGSRQANLLPPHLGGWHAPKGTARFKARINP